MYQVCLNVKIFKECTLKYVCFRRSISSDSLDGICAIINNTCRVLENDYCSILRNRLKQGYPSGYMDLTQAYNVLQNSLQQGRLQPGDAEQTRTAFIVSNKL